jgi:hypothetical protein
MKCDQKKVAKLHVLEAPNTGHVGDVAQPSLPQKLVPFPSLIEPKKFNSVVDTEGILKKVWGKKSVGQIFVFFDM